jgi:hypothetical protein
VRSIFLAIACLSTTVALAQSPVDTNEQRIYNAYVRLRANDTLFVQVTGYEAIGSHQKGFNNSLYWSHEAAPTSTKTELQEFIDGVQIRRVVGDGNSLWSYDLKRKEYAASIYGNYTDTPGQNYERTLLGLLNGTARGTSSYIARLVREVYQPGDTAGYRSWAPGYVPTQLTTVTNDPIVSTRVYAPSSSNVYIAYGTDQATTNRSLVFELTYNSIDDDYDLTHVFYAERSGQGPTARLTDWTMDVVPSPTTDPENFVPYPAETMSTWRPVVGSRPVKIGD